MTRARPPVATTLWGDGLVDDTWDDFIATRDWSLCNPDEYIRVFPKLLPSDHRVADVLQDHLAECVAVRAWRIAGRPATLLESGLRSMDAAEVLERGSRRHADWFADASGVRRLLWRLGVAGPLVDMAAERDALAFLDAILAEVRLARAVALDPAAAVRLAFHAGIHPAYVSLAALTQHERNTAAGWLGVLSRGRAALLPADVADYLRDAIVCENGRAIGFRDPLLARLGHGADEIQSLWRAVVRAKANVAVRRPRPTPIVRPAGWTLPLLAGGRAGGP